MAFQSLSIEAFPDVTDVQVNVVTLFPGHAAEEVEKQVTIPLEIQLSGLPHSVRMFSHTQFGLSFLVLTFDDGVNNYFARQQVLERLQGMELPAGVEPELAPLTTPVGELYRYQLKGSGETRVAIAPRITLLLPSGDSRSGRGFGGIGLQTNFPLSWVMNKHLVTHWNIGGTLVRAAKNPLGDRAAASGYNLGQSFVWLVRPRFNALLETTWIRSQAVVSRNRVESFHDLLLSPSVRWAYNFRSGLQIVPGIAIPVGLGPSAGEKGVFVYLSLEHPFREPRR